MYVSLIWPGSGAAAVLHERAGEDHPLQPAETERAAVPSQPISPLRGSTQRGHLQRELPQRKAQQLSPNRCHRWYVEIDAFQEMIDYFNQYYQSLI